MKGGQKDYGSQIGQEHHQKTHRIQLGSKGLTETESATR